MITFYIDRQGDWRWRVKADNGEIIGASSEGFTSERNCRDNAALLARSLGQWLAAKDTRP